ncbi:Afadin/alpha-actinin-binding [Penicillium capsulatum]|uniref:Afadin/alpha-actinin-binding n=1 Tax=Penicillium capsulatum TaxID=69766 RepID=A0A9W9IPS6_9EURO|nr:Afadin/alpha-actinin-binding [Penicillium capsulatum]KAJ6121376.1 Afadin/alpha-actinin-binding [Penicillium capsulatum]
MEAHNLQAASTYVNNILLARGLLNGGRPIDFASPDNEEGGTDATMARVINLVNDLVLRRDRESEHRENLATTIRTLRAGESEQTVEIGKLKTKQSELTRSLALAEAQERSLKSNMSTAEGTIRKLKDQVQRMKTTVQQVRAQCANDIRKRDLELQKLKSYLAERQRGKREGLSVTTININPNADRSQLGASGGERVNDPEYNLKQETTEFLTELCQSLSDENDTLIELARNTVQTLKELQGFPLVEGQGDEKETAVMDASVGPHKASLSAVTTLPTSCEELSLRMDTVLDHLRTLLTNPSFVPLEEVEIRDEEITRLREGWEKMENRWKQAVGMMDGWQRRLADGGDSIRMDELRRGMTLDLSFTSTEDVSMQDENETNGIPPIMEDQQEEMSETEDQGPESESAPNATSRSKIRKVPERPERALRERSDNATAKPKRFRKVSFTPGLHGSPCEPSADEETLQIKAHQSEAVTRRPSRRKTDTKPIREDDEMEVKMSVHQKLAAAEDEARAARRERESRKRSRPDKSSTRSGNRRRSTLTNDELEGLIGAPSR